MDLHFEFVKVEPVLGFLGVEVVVAVSSRKAKTVEPEVRGQQQTGWTFLIGYSRVPSLPSSVRGNKEMSQGHLLSDHVFNTGYADITNTSSCEWSQDPL